MYHYFSEKRVDNHFLGIGLNEISIIKIYKNRDCILKIDIVYPPPFVNN